MNCSLCDSSDLKKVNLTAKPVATYWQCLNCFLLSREEAERLTESEEESRYLLHVNGNAGHRDFLLPLARRIREHCAENPEMEILDYGSGPISVLKIVFDSEMGSSHVKWNSYDKFFAPTPLPSKVDMIVCAEVIEHFRDPKSELLALRQRLRDRGVLLVMTSPWSEEIDLNKWSYRRDPTHVSLFHQKTMVFLSELGFSLSRQHTHNIFEFRAT